MIIYKEGILSELKKKGYNTNRIRKEKLMAERQLQYIRDNNVTISTLNKICQLLCCQPGELIEYIPDPEGESSNGTPHNPI